MPRYEYIHICTYTYLYRDITHTLCCITKPSLEKRPSFNCITTLLALSLYFSPLNCRFTSIHIKLLCHACNGSRMIDVTLLSWGTSFRLAVLLQSLHPANIAIHDLPTHTRLFTYIALCEWVSEWCGWTVSCPWFCHIWCAHKCKCKCNLHSDTK